jgi:hypothetical protein
MSLPWRFCASDGNLFTGAQRGISSVIPVECHFVQLSMRLQRLKNLLRE